MKKYVILVAGHDYGGGGTNLSLIADLRRKYILQYNPAWTNDPDVIFVRFDVKAGKLERNISDGTTRRWHLENSFDPINRRRHYTRTDFRQQPTNVISIADAYNYIINIGRTEPGTVEEFSVIGHGWQGGPILVNSYQRSEYDSGGPNSRLRDPWDKDGRNKDFLADNLNNEDWNSFKLAFTDMGFIWIWGCVFTRAYYNTLYVIMRSSEFRAKRFGTHVDSDTFTINVNRSFVSKYYNTDRTFFPTDDNERTFTRSLLQVKQFLIRGLKNTYSTRVAGDTGIECRAGYLGTYAGYERSSPGNYVQNRVMVVPRSRSIYGDDFSKTVNFYKMYLNIPEDPENRGYARYIRTQVHQWFQTS